AEFRGLSERVDVEIISAEIEDLTITGLAIRAPAGGDGQNLAALGRFNNGQEFNLTESVDWSVSDTQVADVANVPGRKGFFRGFSPANVQVEARFGNFRVKKPHTIQPALLRHLGFDCSFEREHYRGCRDQLSELACPAAGDFPRAFPHFINQKRQLQAFGYFSDCSVAEVTADATFSSLNTDVATFIEPSNGVVTFLSPGTGDILASLDDQEVRRTITVQS